jgi:hypothetical protein
MRVGAKFFHPGFDIGYSSQIRALCAYLFKVKYFKTMEDTGMKKSLILILTVSLISLLTGCQYFQNNKETNQVARCKEMRSQMMFNGTTTNPSQAFQQRSDQDLLNESYHAEDC